MILSRGDRSRPFRRIVVVAVVVTAVATFALILVALVLPARTALALRWYLLAIGVIAVVTAIRAFLTRYPVLWRSTRDPTAKVPVMPAEVPARLRAMHSLVTRSRWDAAGFQLELRPILLAIAAQRLATYRTIDLDGDPDAARAALGERVWTFLTPVDLEAARREREVDLADVRLTVETLEKLHDIAHD